MKRLFTMVLSLMLGASLFADNELLVGDINMSATVNPIGGASITIPIEVPTGVNGMQPNLALVYNSHSGYGLAGWGWNLAGVSSIQRTGKTIYHDNTVEGIKYDRTDNLLLDGERLILMSGANLWVESIYHTERESFNRVICLGNTFQVHSKEGLTSLYGMTGNSQNAISWYITQTEDLNGNYIAYTYNKEEQEITVSKIGYTYNENQQYSYSIEFHYIDAPRTIRFYVGDQLFEKKRLLSKITVKSDTRILYTYNLAYDYSLEHPRLISVQKVAANGDCYPPTLVTWNTTGNQSEMTVALPQSRKDKVVFGDFNQDGLTDIVSYNTNSTVFTIFTNTTNNGNLSFSATSFDSGRSFQDLRAADYNGDGRMDLVGRYTAGGTNNVAFLIAQGSAFTTFSDCFQISGTSFLVGDFDGDGCDEILNPETFRIYSYGEGYIATPSITIWDDAHGHIHSMGENNVPLDFDGNGITDILLTTSSLYYIFEYDILSSSFVQKMCSPLSSINATQTLGSIRFGDFNGDGKTDILSLAYDESYALNATIYNNGYIRERTEEVFSSSIFVGDYNMDGVDDIAYIATNSSDKKVYVRVGINDGETFVYNDQVMTSYTSDAAIDRSKLYFRDMYGTGFPALFYLGGSTSVVAKRLFTSNGLLVNKITDGMGNTYDFTYKSITNSNVYTNTRGSGASVNPLVQPFYVVSDYTAPYTSLSYHYKNGRYHTKGKGLLGFEELTVTDNMSNTCTNHVNGITTSHFCHYPVTSTKMTLDGDTIYHQKYRYTIREMGGKRIFPHSSGYEYTDYLTTLKETCISDIDDNGNLDNETKTRGDWMEYSKYYYTTAGSWCPNRLDNTYTYSIYNGETSPYRRAHYQYDNRGNMIRKVVDSLNTNYRIVHQYTYDTFGNVTREIVSGSGQTRTRTYTYSVDGRFQLTTTDELGQTITNSYDSDWGTLLTQTTNAGVTTNSYDAFGRLCKVIYPDSVVYTVSSQFVSSVPGVRYMACESRTNTSPVTTYYNAVGKPLYKMKMGHNDRQIYTTYTYYPNGAEKVVSEPYFSTDITTAASQAFTSDDATLYTYDEYNRPLRVENPEGITVYTYNGLNTTVNTPTVNKAVKLNSSGFTEYERIGPALIPIARIPSFLSLYKSVSYTYYPTGQIKTATPDGGTAVTMEYDLQGNRTKLIDPDAGTITNTYNAFGQVLSRSQNIHNSTPVITTYSYESTNGRLLTETTVGDTAMTKTYTYDGIFKNNPYQIKYSVGEYMEYSYDEYGRLRKMCRRNADPMLIRMTDTYQYGKLIERYRAYAGTTYYTYDDYGNMIDEKLKTRTGQTEVVWKLLEQNARGQIVKEQKGDVITTYTYDKCGRVLSIVAPGIIDLAYVYDERGNVVSKVDNICNQTMDYTYDQLMRLTSWTINDSVTHTVTYDAATGNIISKSDLGEQSAFSYDASSKPHALRSVSGVAGDWGEYDMDITYTDFSKVKSIQGGGVDYQIEYTPDEQRFKSVLSEKGHTVTRYYMPDSEIIIDSLGKRKTYAYLCHGDFGYGNGTAAYVARHGYYDAQGSLIVLRTPTGSSTTRYAYDPWGTSVDPNDWTKGTTAPEHIYMRRGYTMHERLREFDLINMNGRVYDPAVAQFLSPDPYIQDAGNWLNYNRYAYCYNNPTRYVDPDGEIAITTAFLLGVAASAAIDYGTQVVMNYLVGNHKGKDAWVNNVDFFDVAVSGVIGGFTAGLGSSYKTGESIGKIGTWFVKNQKIVKLGEMFLTSAIDVTGSGVQKVGFEQFGTRMLIGGMTWTASNMISEAIANKNGISLEFKKTYDYELDPYGDNVVLYRGISGTEGKGGALFLTANREYAMEYLKDGGSIASITLSRSTLDLMERTGALIQLQGTIHNGLETGIEYQIKSKQVIDEIIKRFRYTNVYK